MSTVKSRRELMLEEMGLTPVWRLRADDAQGGEQPADMRTHADASTPRGDHEPQVTHHTPRVPAPEPRVTRHDSPVPRPSSLDPRPAPPAARNDERRGSIMSMDWPA